MGNLTKQIEELYKCPVCELTLSIWRKKGKQRESGHLKSMYCPACEYVKNFIKVDL